MRSTLIATLLAALVCAACSGDDSTSERPRATATSTTSASRVTSSSPHDGSFAPAATLAALAGCTPTDQTPAPEAGPAPIEAVACTLGGGQGVTIRTYASTSDVDAVLAASAAFCGFRVMGERFTVAADTPETAELVSAILGGRVVTFEGC